MLGLDHLQQIVTYLDRQTDGGAKAVPALNQFLTAIYDSEDYRKWLERDQYAGAMSYVGRPNTPAEAARKHPGSKRILDQFLLCANGKLEIKVDTHSVGQGRSRIHITDGYWVPDNIRVYPDADESELLCRYIREHKYHKTPGLTLIDPACGCGHHALALPEIERRISMDISIRALAFARLNAILASDERHLLCVNDIQDGLPTALLDFVAGPVLFCVNMPFRLMPPIDETSTKESGGERGTTLTLSAIRAIADFSARAKHVTTTRAVVLAYSLRRTKRSKVEQEVVLEAQSIFEERRVAAKIEWRALPNENLWRINGKKEERNPMPVSRLSRKAQCAHTFRPDNMNEARLGYENMAAAFVREGWTELEYGILDIEVTPKAPTKRPKTTKR